MPIIADGGIRSSGDIAKALAAGARPRSCSAACWPGLDESPGETILYRGRTFKAVRGMGSLGAMSRGQRRPLRPGRGQGLGRSSSPRASRAWSRRKRRPRRATSTSWSAASGRAWDTVGRLRSRTSVSAPSSSGSRPPAIREIPPARPPDHEGSAELQRREPVSVERRREKRWGADRRLRHPVLSADRAPRARARRLLADHGARPRGDDARRGCSPSRDHPLGAAACSVYENDAPTLGHANDARPQALPVLGICYGQQWLTQTLGGKVVPGERWPVSTVGPSHRADRPTTRLLPRRAPRRSDRLDVARRPRRGRLPEGLPQRSLVAGRARSPRSADRRTGGSTGCSSIPRSRTPKFGTQDADATS